MNAPTSPLLYMDATIRPNRSLSRQGFLVMLAVLGGFNIVMAIFFLLIGALPVPVFLGLDFVLLWVAFRVSYRRGRVAERVQVSAEAVTVGYEDGARRRTVWRSPTAFTRVALDAPGGHAARVSLRLRSRVLILAAALSPSERTAFGQALEGAIRAARRERYDATSAS